MDYLQFDGVSSYCEVPDSPDLSIATTGALSVAAWIRPDTLTFSAVEGSGYVHCMGKGETGREEWKCRMYSQDNSEGRDNRISFYVFHPEPGKGIGAYVQEPVTAGEWIHIVGVADGSDVHLYRDGALKNTQHYGGKLTPVHGAAPLRLGTCDFASYFQGALAEVRIWNRALSADEARGLYTGSNVPRDGLRAEYLFRLGGDSADGHDAAVNGASSGSDAQARAGLRAGER